jgi:hypothetical protein
VKGTVAEPAVATYQKAIEQDDEDFQKKVKALQQDYMKKVEAPYKTYVTALRNAQAAETKKRNLEGALAVKNLADAVEASGPPVAPEVEGAKRQPAADAPGGKGAWTVLFRSADPSIWNSDTNKGPTYFALPLKRAPAGVQYLKLTLGNGAGVIIPMTNQLLGTTSDIGKGMYRWNGTGHFNSKAYHLGIADTDLPVRKGCVSVHAGNPDEAGWGFGHHHAINDNQGFAWAGQEIGPAVFEISVKTAPLTEAEKINLLKG